MHEELSISPNALEELPTKTGVYVLRGKRSESVESTVLYIGKAKNLRSRVRQYFVGDTDTRPFVKFIREKVDAIHYTVVETEQDALILENELIKKYRPAYNISLRDDKRYLSLRIDTTHEWPKIDVVRKIRKDGAFYFGPFSSSGRLKMTLDFMHKVFQLRSCTDHKLYNRSRPCIEYELKRCVAPCVNYITKGAYDQIVESALLFLKGNEMELLNNLKTEMEASVRIENYEKAAEIRNRIQAIESITEGQSVVGHQQLQRGLDQDVIGFAQDATTSLIVLLFVRNGILLDKRTFEIKNIGLDPESLMLEFLTRYYSFEVYIPHEILVPIPIDTSLLELDTKIMVPRSEEKTGFIEIAMENATAQLQSIKTKIKTMEKSLTALQKSLGLSKIPRSIDCFDISHHQGLENVASVVRFQDGVPAKDFYRKIKISEDKVDDFASMSEAVERRYIKREDFPDLIVIDGGKGQLSAAREVLERLGWLKDIELISLAKARDFEGIDPLNPQNRERVFKIDQKNPILLRADSAEELLLRFIRDEAHRFAIRFHRERKVKTLSVSVLDQVPGMTERIKLKLLRRFGGIEGIVESDDVDLMQEIPKKMLGSIRLTLKEALGQ
ncbi:MAG: Excinuclease subunit [Bacteriovoracaceae bacterium]|nr:Excinuclease subunit [Bacteriovoracaceae bacterium]